MKKFNKKAINVLTTAAIVASIAAPMTAGAAGAGTISATSVPTVSDSAVGATLGSIKVTIPAGTTLNSGDRLIVKLPGDVDRAAAFTAANIQVPATFNGENNSLADANGAAAGTITSLNVDARTDADEIYLSVAFSDAAASYLLETDGVFFISLDNITLDDVSAGPVEVTLEASPSSAFPVGKVTVANVSGGEVQVSASSLDTSNDNYSFTLKLKETVAGSLEAGAESVKVKLPNGYEWNETDFANPQTINATYGNDIQVRLTGNSNDDELEIEVVAVDRNNDGDFADAGEVGGVTSEPSFWELTDMDFRVDDESKVKVGDIIAKISGESDLDISSLKVSTYGEFSTQATAAEATKVVAGKDEQEIADITIAEGIGGTLVNGRSVTLTLPEGARWQSEYEDDVAGNAISVTNPAGNTDSEEGLALTFRGYTGTDNRTAKFEVTGTTTVGGDAGSFTLEDIELALEAGFSGDLEVEVGGTAGVTGKIKVAEVKSGVTAAAASAPNVVIGLSNQKAGEFTISEELAETFEDNQTVTLDLPSGVFFVGTPKVEVTEGDLRITNVRRSANDNQVFFDIDGESTEASKIKVSGVELKVDRTVAEGDIKVDVLGLAETAQYSDWTNSDTAVSVVVAKVATPAPGDTTGSAKFVIDSTTYTVNGVEKTLDVAPFIQDGRTFLPVRFVAEALGVSESNIIWNANTKTVTLIKGDRIAQIQLGSSNLVVNGVSVPMDTVAFTKEGRTVLPLRYAAQALGAKVEWDEATRTVSIN